MAALEHLFDIVNNIIPHGWRFVNGAELELTGDGATIEGWQESWAKGSALFSHGLSMDP